MLKWRFAFHESLGTLRTIRVHIWVYGLIEERFLHHRSLSQIGRKQINGQRESLWQEAQGEINQQVIGNLLWAEENERTNLGGTLFLFKVHREECYFLVLPLLLSIFFDTCSTKRKWKLIWEPRLTKEAIRLVDYLFGCQGLSYGAGPLPFCNIEKIKHTCAHIASVQKTLIGKKQLCKNYFH